MPHTAVNAIDSLLRGYGPFRQPSGAYFVSSLSALDDFKDLFQQFSELPRDLKQLNTLLLYVMALLLHPTLRSSLLCRTRKQVRSVSKRLF